jgi:hypothetical protein
MIDFDFLEEMASHGQLDSIESLLKTANLSEKHKEYIEWGMKSYTYSQAKKEIEYLLNNQTCPIECGRNYTQTDIKWKVSQL